MEEKRNKFGVAVMVGVGGVGDGDGSSLIEVWNQSEKYICYICVFIILIMDSIFREKYIIEFFFL